MLITAQGNMKADGYASDELKSFYRVLEAAKSEVAARALELPLHAMIERLFDAADRGERNPQNLKAAILAGPNAAARMPRDPSAPTRKRRPILTLFAAQPAVVTPDMDTHIEEVSYGK